MNEQDDMDDIDANEVAWQFNPDRAAWSALGVHTAADAAAWEAVGFAPQTLQGWRDFFEGQSADPDQVTVEEFGPWLDAGLTAVEVVWEWFNAGFAPQTAAAWVRVGMDSEWVVGLRSEVSIEDAVRGWSAAGFDDPKDRAWWSMLMLDPQQARRWCDLISEVHDPQRHRSQWEEACLAAREWEIRGYAPEHAVGWIAQEIEIDYAADWIHHGFTNPAQVKALMAEGHTDPVRALSARLSG